MANPHGDLPVVITSAMVIVISGFCMMNAAIYVVLPFEIIRSSTTVAVVRLLKKSCPRAPTQQHHPSHSQCSSTATQFSVQSTMSCKLK